MCCVVFGAAVDKAHGEAVWHFLGDSQTLSQPHQGCSQGSPYIKQTLVIIFHYLVFLVLPGKLWVILLNGNYQAHLSSPTETQTLKYVIWPSIFSFNCRCIPRNGYYNFNRYFIYFKNIAKKKRYFGCAFPDGTYLSRMMLSWNGWGWKECFELIWSKFPSQAESSGAGWPRHFLSEYLFCRRRKLLVSLPLHVFKGILMLVCYYDDIFITIYYYNIFFSTRKLFA